MFSKNNVDCSERIFNMLEGYAEAIAMVKFFNAAALKKICVFPFNATTLMHHKL